MSSLIVFVMLTMNPAPVEYSPLSVPAAYYNISGSTMAEYIPLESAEEGYANGPLGRVVTAPVRGVRAVAQARPLRRVGGFIASRRPLRRVGGFIFRGRLRGGC